MPGKMRTEIAGLSEGKFREPISILPENLDTKEGRQARKAMMPLLRKVIKAIVIKRPLTEEMLAEVYFAGIWHGAEIMRQKDLPPRPPARKPDVIDVNQPRRGKRRSPHPTEAPHD